MPIGILRAKNGQVGTVASPIGCPFHHHQRRKTMANYLTRDSSAYQEYNLHVRKPAQVRSGVYLDFVANIEADDFHKLFPGIELKPGEVRKIKSITIVLEEE